MPKLIVAVRDPVDWILSIFQHNDSMLGLGVYDWQVPDYEATRGSWFGKDHAQFGTSLEFFDRMVARKHGYVAIYGEVNDVWFVDRQYVNMVMMVPYHMYTVHTVSSMVMFYYVVLT